MPVPTVHLLASCYVATLVINESDVEVVVRSHKVIGYLSWECYYTVSAVSSWDEGI